MGVQRRGARASSRPPALAYTPPSGPEAISLTRLWAASVALDSSFLRHLCFFTSSETERPTGQKRLDAAFGKIPACTAVSERGHRTGPRHIFYCCWIIRKCPLLPVRNIGWENQVSQSIGYFLKILKTFPWTRVQISRPRGHKRCVSFSRSHSPFPVEDVQHYNQPSHYQQDSNGQSDDQMDEVFIRYCGNTGTIKCH